MSMEDNKDVNSYNAVNDQNLSYDDLFSAFEETH